MVTMHLLIANKVKDIAHPFTQFILSRHLDVDVSLINIQRDFNGKPFLIDYPGTHFNLSHTLGAVVVAVADKPVGVDIECLCRPNKAMLERYFSEKDINYVYQEPVNQSERYAEVWTRKESCIKKFGLGLASCLNLLKMIECSTTISYRVDNYCVSVCSTALNMSIPNGDCAIIDHSGDEKLKGMFR